MSGSPVVSHADRVGSPAAQRFRSDREHHGRPPALGRADSAVRSIPARSVIIGWAGGHGAVPGGMDDPDEVHDGHIDPMAERTNQGPH